MGPQQSSSPLLPFLFQSRLPLRCAPSTGLCRNVRYVFTVAARSWRRQKLSGGVYHLCRGVLNLYRRRLPW
jgi:hypothetical protein